MSMTLTTVWLVGAVCLLVCVAVLVPKAERKEEPGFMGALVLGALLWMALPFAALLLAVIHRLVFADKDNGKN